MKHFIVEITYIAPIPAIDAALTDHRAFLQDGYDRGLLLCSGPQDPRVGAFLVARASDRDELSAFLRGDPFQTRNLARYRIVEFVPVKHQGFLDAWVTGPS